MLTFYDIVMSFLLRFFSRLKKLDGRRFLAWNLIVCSFSIPTFLPGQTTFEWPNVSVDYSSYMTLEECLAATSRINKFHEDGNPVYIDTMPYDPRENFLPLPDEVISVGRQCAQRFISQITPIDRWRLLTQLYLQANLDTNAISVASARLKAVSDDYKERFAVLDSIVVQFAFSRPSKVSLAEPFIQQLKDMVREFEVDRSSTELRVKGYFRLYNISLIINDSTSAREFAYKMGAVADSLSENDIVSDWFREARLQIYTALTFLSATDYKDSLKKSTKAFAALHRFNWSRSIKREVEGALPFARGESAAPLEADFWFPTTPQSGVPARGKISVVYFFNRCKDLACWDEYYTIRRIAKRFPELEITLVMQTGGWFSDASPPAPEQEAQYASQKWLGFHKLPVSLAVTSSEFMKLPYPDNRRLNQKSDNYLNYFSFPGQPPGMQADMFLIDRNGTIVTSSLMQRASEGELVEMIEILMDRKD